MSDQPSAKNVEATLIRQSNPDETRNEAVQQEEQPIFTMAMMRDFVRQLRAATPYKFPVYTVSEETLRDILGEDSESHTDSSY
jgi:hypothetical protein